MPYKSKAQQAYFHAHEDEIGKDVVKEFDEATKGKYDKLPKKKSSRMIKASRILNK